MTQSVTVWATVTNNDDFTTGISFCWRN